MGLQKERDALRNQQQGWDDLRRTAEQVETLSRLIGAADSEEVQDLKRVRDESKVLQKEYASLQKRCADQEAKIATLQRTSSTTKQTMAQSQQKLSEWEKRARGAEEELDDSRVRLEQARESQQQSDARIASLEHDVAAKLDALLATEVCIPYV